MNIPENILSTLTDEQKKKIAAANTPEDLLSIAKETGYELSDEQLSALSGGSWGECSDYWYCHDYYCPPVK